jgi:hypothetical protein
MLPPVRVRSPGFTPYTLKGLTTALEKACVRSHGGTPQILVVTTDGKGKAIRRFEDGYEAPVPPPRQSLT